MITDESGHEVGRWSVVDHCGRLSSCGQAVEQGERDVLFLTEDAERAEPGRSAPRRNGVMETSSPSTMVTLIERWWPTSRRPRVCRIVVGRRS
jgi:hypothetical protein